MRSLWRSSSLLKRPASCHKRALSTYNPERLLTKNQPCLSPRRFLSSVPSAPDDTQPNIHASTRDIQEAPTPIEEPEKPKRRSRVSAATKDLEPLPDDLDILWTPDATTSGHESPTASALPPSEMLEEALHNLHIILHPKTQHRSIYASPSGPPVEPTFALFCPIEGGEYTIDATVQELARRTGSDVVVLDAVQLAAGEWGAFGKGMQPVLVVGFVFTVLE
jgi:hypothetical protein